MDVRCSRCSTDYEFDDALISERGTTVKCTNCGFQFKIYPPSTGAAAPERWVVRTATGHEVVFTSLRELQRGISERKVGPNDLLSRGNQPARPLGAIPELEPFFVRDGGGPSHGFQSLPRTLHGVAPPPSGAPRPKKDERPTGRGLGRAAPPRPETPNPSATLPLQSSGSPSFQQRAPDRVLLSDVAPTEPVPDWPDEPPEPPPKPVKPPKPAEPGSPAAKPLSGDTVRLSDGGSRSLDATLPAVPAPARPPEAPRAKPAFDSTLDVTAPLGSSLPKDHPAGSSTPGTAAAARAKPAPAAPAASGPGAGSAVPVSGSLTKTAPSALPPAAVREKAPPSSAGRGLTPSPPAVASAPVSSRDRFPSYDDTALPEIAPERRARSRWIAGIVVLGVVGLLAATVGRQYASRFTSAATPEGGARDERASRFLSEGIRLLDQADYDAAQEQLLKAQALADRDPAVLAQLARLETSRADLTWLRLRLLDPTSAALVQATHRELGRRVGKAQKAVDAAFAVAPEDPAVARARVDALRLAGEEKKAREWIAPIAAAPSDPENAYVLAALDLAEAAPAWDTVIDRLRSAAVSEREATRARGALVYALVRAGRGAEAETELAKVANAAKPHPLLEELREFVERFKSPADAGTDADEDASTLDPRALPALDTSPVTNEKPTAAGERQAPAEPKLPVGDFRTRLSEASKAVSAGNLATAEALYQSVVNEQPGNTEALAGLADVARKRGDSAAAARLYAKVLERNPSYLPALMASADAKWEAGDRKGALTLYQRIVEQTGGSTDYGRRAQSRIQQAEGDKGSEGTPSAAPTPATTGQATPAPSNDAGTP